MRKTVVHGEENATAVRRLAEGKCFDKVSRIFADGTHLFILLSQLVEILISTKGVDKVDTPKTLPLGESFGQSNRRERKNLSISS
ncbi:hypothetical protein [Anaerotignum sp.]